MIYTCDTKCCHFIFFGSAETRVCPDCGKHSIRPSTLEERAALPSSKEKPFRMLSSEGFHLLSSVVMYGYGSSCDVFLIRRLLAATIGTVHGLSVDVFAFQFYHASVYQSIEEISHTHNLCTPFQ